MTMTDAQAISNLVHNFKKLAKNYLKIIDKKGNIVLLILNDAQKIVYSKYKSLIDAGKPVRIILLKARQMGMSTLTEGLIYQRNSFDENRKAGIVAHVAEASSNLFNMFKTYHKHLPEELKPQLDKSNEKKMSYGLLDSSIKISTAESGDGVGRSDTYQDLHLSEVAFWRDADTVMTALLQTVPDEPNTMIIVESTANGVGGWFHETWVSAENGENDYTPIFLSWFDLPDYTRPFADKEEKKHFKKTMDTYEITLKKNFPVTYEQLNWYRYTRINKLKGSYNSMKQEYPSTAEEAFVASGRPVFDNEICFKNYSKSKRPAQRTTAYIDKEGNLQWSEHGFIELHHPITLSPREQFVFVAGVDIAEGLEQGDRSIIKVMDRRTSQVVLTWSGHIDPDLLAYEILYIQKLLHGKVHFNIEKNNHGFHTVVKCFELGVNMKYQQDFTKGYKSESHHGFGHITNLKTKPLIIDQLNTWIREDLFGDDEREFWSECMTFVKDEKGKMSAQDKLKDPKTKIYDDRVIASALMIDCHVWLPSYHIEKQKEGVRLLQDKDGVAHKITETTM